MISRKSFLIFFTPRLFPKSFFYVLYFISLISTLQYVWKTGEEQDLEQLKVVMKKKVGRRVTYSGSSTAGSVSFIGPTLHLFTSYFCLKSSCRSILHLFLSHTSFSISLISLDLLLLPRAFLHLLLFPSLVFTSFSVIFLITLTLHLFASHSFLRSSSYNSQSLLPHSFLSL